MKKIGIKAFVARDKQEATAEMKKRKYNYVLVDLFLPDSEDGLEVIEEAIKLKNEGRQNFKIIVTRQPMIMF